MAVVTRGLQSVRTLAVLFLAKRRGQIDNVPRVINKKGSSTRRGLVTGYTSAGELSRPVLRAHVSTAVGRVVHPSGCHPPVARDLSGPSGILWWNVLIPRLNPFDVVYNRTPANRPGAVRLEPAPPPRRFAQGMAGSFALAIGMLLPLPETPFSSRKKRLFERGLRSNRLPAHESDRSIPKISAL